MLWADPFTIVCPRLRQQRRGDRLSFAPDEARLGFYAAVSQILPVLLLVLVVEVRAFNVKDIRPSDRRERTLVYVAAAYGLFLLVVFALAEITALDALASGHANDGDPATVYRALAFAFAAIAGVAILGKPAARER